MSSVAPSQGSFFARAALGAAGVQVLGSLASFVVAVVLARTLGDRGYGAFEYALTWFLLLAQPATGGAGPLVTREVAAGLATAAPGRVRAVVRFAWRVWAVGSPAVVALAGGLALAAAPGMDPDNAEALWRGMPLVAGCGAVLLGRAWLTGLRRVVAAQALEAVLRPLVLLGLVACGAWAGVAWTAPRALLGFGIATVVLLAAQAALVAVSTPPEVRAAVPTPQPGWAGSLGALAATGLARGLSAEAGVLVLGTLLSPSDVAFFRAASRFASMPSTLLANVNAPLMPVASGLFAQGDLAQIERLGVRSSRVAVLVSLPVVSAFVVFGGPLLSLFGPGFAAGRPALGILALGHLYNVACGSVGLILVACRREDDVARAVVVTSVGTLALTVVSTRLWGLAGAAVATSLGLVAWNTWLTVVLWWRFRILPAAFSLRRVT